MNTAQILDEVNARFYARFAQHFHQTRNHGWSGWNQIPCILPHRPLRVFDVGCGNGRLAQFLEDAWITREGGSVTDYLGVDQCAGLLEHAAKKTYSFPTVWGPWSWADVLDAGKPDFQDENNRYDWITLFGVMHHIHGHARRVRILEWASQRLNPGGVISISLWDFGARAKWDKKRLPWSDYADDWGLDLSTLEPGDHLLGWAEHTDTPRYCHWMSRDEEHRFVADVNAACTGRLEAGVRMDTGTDLNRYWNWRAVN